MKKQVELKLLSEDDALTYQNFFDTNKRIDYVLAYERDDENDDENEIPIVDDGNEENGKNKNKQKLKRKTFLQNLEFQGLKIKYYSPTDQKIVYVFIHTPDEQLLNAAEKTKLKFPFEVNDLKSDKPCSCCQKIPNPCRLPEDIDTQHYERAHFTTTYSSKFKGIFKKFEDKNFADFLLPKDRTLLTYEYLIRTSYKSRYRSMADLRTNDVDNDHKIGIARLLSKNIFVAAYPIHENLDKKLKYDEIENATVRQKLWEYWGKLSFRNFLRYQPINLIREYFGEKIAFYFSWLGFYTRWLLLPSILGLAVIIYGSITVFTDIPTNEICNQTGRIGRTLMCRLCAIEGHDKHCHEWRLSESCVHARITYIFDNTATVFFALIMSVWSIVFIQFWKRKENELQFDWDIIDFENKFDLIRPEYEITVKSKRINPVTGEMEPYVPGVKKTAKYMTSVTSVLFMICLAIALFISIITYRVTIFIVLSRNKEWRRYSHYVATISAAIINLIVILILDRFYVWLACKLTDLERHKTNSSYEKALTVKIYLFQFFNLYSSIFYIAFVKGKLHRVKTSASRWYLEPCDPAGCLVEVTIQLATIMIGKQLKKHFKDLIVPKLRQCIKGVNKHKGKPQCVRDFFLEDWDNMTLFREYFDMVIQFGFMTIFIVAFPVAPIVALFNNIFEIRKDAFRFILHMRRPLAQKAQNIGIWIDILTTMSKIGVVTSGLMIPFTTEFIPRLVYKISYNRTDLNGFVDFSLSKKRLIDMNLKTHNFTALDTCKYRDFRYGPESPNKYSHTMDYYHILVAKLLFFVFYEHLTFFIVSCVQWIIPEVPYHVKTKIERENFVTQRAIWQANENE